MLYTSAKSRLLKALGEASFTDSLHATAPADLTVRGYAGHLAAQAAPHPLTERERALQEVKQAEYEASKEDAFRGTGGGVRGGAGPLSAVMGVGAGLEWGEGVEEALKEIAAESSGTSSDKRKVVGLQIDPKVNTRLNLALSTSATLDELRTHLPAEGPQYTIFSHLPAGAARPVVVFVYSCPPKSPIRTRMVYSSSVGSLISKIKERAGVEVDKKVPSHRSFLTTHCTTDSEADRPSPRLAGRDVGAGLAHQSRDSL
jgi:twinfilin-like protein